MDLQGMRDKIDTLSKEHHIEIAKLFLQDEVPYNENQNGIFVNLSIISECTYTKIVKYIDFISTKVSSLSETETQKDLLLATHFKN